MRDQTDSGGVPDPSRWGDEADRSVATDERILLLLEPGRDRELFAERLDDREVVVADPTPGEPLPAFDLCLVDTATYGVVETALAERKAETGTYLPVLLVVGADEEETTARMAADVADDILPLPTAEPILRSRVESLLRARRGSLELDAERERFRTLAETAPNAILTMDAAGVIRYANPGVESVFGHPPEDVVGERLTMLIPPALREAHREGLSQYLETGERGLDWQGSRLPGFHADGHEIPLLVSFAEHHTDGERRFTGILQDVTEHVEREDRLAQVADLLERTQAIADVGGWEVDPDARAVEWTDQVHAIFGREFEGELPLEEAIAYYHPEDRPVIEDAIERALTRGESFDVELRIERPDGEVRWVRARGEPVAGAAGTGLVRGAVQDITERKERERELERTVDLFNRAQDISDIGGWEIDSETEDVLWTDQVYEIVGYPSDEPEPSLEEAFSLYHPEDRPVIEGAVETALAEGEPFDVEVRIQPRDGEYRWVRVLGEPVTADGAATALRGTFQDITERKERERVLERYESVLESTPESAWILDRDLEVVFVDSAAAAEIGMTRAEMIGTPTEAFADWLFPDTERYRAYVEAAEAVLAGERESATVTTELLLDDGAVTIEISLSPLIHGGDIEGVVGLARDITERKERERELARTVDMLDRAENIADVGGWQYDPAAEEMLWTDQVFRIAGLDPADGEPDIEAALDYYHPEDRPVIADAVERAIEEGVPYDLELRLVRPSGQERWVRAIGEPETVDGRRVLRGAFQDIHDRKERERELERTVEQLQQTRDIADVSGWEYDPGADEVWWDEKVWDIYGQLESFEPTADSVLGLYTPDSRSRMERAMERAVLDAEPFDLEIALDTEPTRWVRVTGDPEVENGRTTLVRGVVRDITQRKRREEFLERHERIVETSSEPIYTLDDGLRFTLVNSALAELVGRDREALVGEHVSAVFDDAYAEALGDAATRLYAHGDGEPTTIETTVTDVQGRTRRFQTTISPKLDADGLHGLVCVSHDVTDVTEHERRLSVLDRVLRHNLRNKMNVVLARARSIQETADDAEAIEAGASIEAAAEELLGLGEAARSFHDALDPSQQDLVGSEDIAEHARHVVEAARLSYEGVAIEADLPEHAPAVVHAEFELALSELVDNAATHGGPGTAVRVEVETDGDEVVVRVLDNGPGIPALEQRALEAGWESPLQHATGLGLWFVQWTVRNSGGRMRIANREGGGAVVELRLPAAGDDA